MHVFRGIRGGAYEISGKEMGKGGFGRLYEAHVLADTPFLAAGSKAVVKQAKKVEPETRAVAENRLYDLRYYGKMPSRGEAERKGIPAFVLSADTDARLAMAADSQKAVLESYEIERRVLEAVKHPNIVQLHDFGEESGIPFIVEELCPGNSLNQRQSFLEIGQWRLIAAGLLDAISALHAAGFLHNDVHDANVMFDGEHMKLLDFGTCVTFEEGRQGKNRGFKGGGESPELRHGLRYDIRSDVYSAASLLICSLNYKMRGFGESMRAVLRKSLEENPSLRHESAEKLKTALL